MTFPINRQPTTHIDHGVNEGEKTKMDSKVLESPMVKGAGAHKDSEKARPAERKAALEDAFRERLKGGSSSVTLQVARFASRFSKVEAPCRYRSPSNLERLPCEQRVKNRAIAAAKEQFMRVTGYSAREFDNLFKAGSEPIEKCIHEKREEIKKIDAEKAAKLQMKLQHLVEDIDGDMNHLEEKLIGISVAIKNGQAADPNFLSTVQTIVNGTKTALAMVAKLNANGKGSHELKAKEKKLNGILNVLMQLSGARKEPDFNEDQRILIENMKIPIKDRKDVNSKQLSELVNKMTKAELQAVVDQAEVSDYISPNYQNNGLVFSNLIQQNLFYRSPYRKERLIENSPLNHLVAERNAAYNSSARALAKNAKKYDVGYNDFKSTLISISNTLTEIFGPSGTDIKQKLEDSEKKVRGATDEDARTALLAEMDSEIKAEFSRLVKHMKDSILPSKVSPDDPTPTIRAVPREEKDAWKTAIQARMPQYNAPIYDTTPANHGFDRIYALLTSPAPGESSGNSLGLQIASKEALENARGFTGLDYKRKKQGMPIKACHLW